MQFLRRHPDAAQLGLALLDRADAVTIAHVGSCAACQRRRDRLAARLAASRVAAHAAADAAFPPAALDRQRHAILQRIARVTAARVLPFPRATEPPPATSAQGPDRRWVVGAAAAGLLIGLAVGQLTPGWRTPASQAPAAVSTPVSPPDPRRDDTLLSDVEELLTRQVRPEFEALDGLTPITHEAR